MGAEAKAQRLNGELAEMRPALQEAKKKAFHQESISTDLKGQIFRIRKELESEAQVAAEGREEGRRGKVACEEAAMEKQKAEFAQLQSAQLNRTLVSARHSDDWYLVQQQLDVARRLQ